MEIVVVAVAVALGAAFLVYLIRARSPERLAGHERPPGWDRERTPSDDLYRGTDRPAGPDAEEQRPN